MLMLMSVVQCCVCNLLTLSELYSYSEEPEFLQSKCCFEDLARRSGMYGVCFMCVCVTFRFLFVVSDMFHHQGLDIDIWFK